MRNVEFPDLNVKKINTAKTELHSAVKFSPTRMIIKELAKYDWEGPSWIEAFPKKGVMLRIYWGRESGLPPFESNLAGAPDVYVSVSSHVFRGNRTLKIIFGDQPSAKIAEDDYIHVLERDVISLMREYILNHD